MSKFRSVFVGIALVAGTLPGMAPAATMVATYTGTVFDSIDQTNLFGAGNSLDGLAFEAIFVYDPETPGASRGTGSQFDAVAGGAELGLFSSPIRSVELTINTHTKYIGARSFGGAIITNNGRISDISHSAIDRFTTLQESFTSNSIGIRAASAPLFPLFPADLNRPIPFTSLTSLVGGFEFNECAFNDVGGCDVTIRTVGSLSASSVRVAPIPIPAALPLLASGLAGLGFVAFRRRRAA